jgi:hypothetical protein
VDILLLENILFLDKYSAHEYYYFPRRIASSWRIFCSQRIFVPGGDFSPGGYSAPGEYSVSGSILLLEDILLLDDILLLENTVSCASRICCSWAKMSFSWKIFCYLGIFPSIFFPRKFILEMV